MLESHTKLPLILLQKSALPNFEQLLVPPFESEAKRINAAAAKAAKPQQNVSVVEAGTSVAPRSRPKGSSTVHGQNALGLGLPPSPLPRQNITSPQPQPVVEQFQANFPAMPTVAASTPAVAASATAAVGPASTGTATASTSTTAVNSLFESSVYPDPFNENAPTAAAGAATTTATTTNSAIAPSTDVGNEQLPEATVNDLSTSAGGGGGTPTKHMLTPPKSNAAAGGVGGHRRNVSDTSAFNK